MTFDLARLCADAREDTYYIARDGVKITLFYTYPTPGKLGAAFKKAGMELDKDGQPKSQDGSDNLVGIDVASVTLARLCIEHVEGIEMDGPLKSQTGYGIPMLSDPWTAALDRNALYHLGQHLMSASKVSEEEGKDSEPSPSSDTSED